jgi:hypothetical protein
VPTEPGVPVELRAALKAELDALVRGHRPAMLTWVERYGGHGAQLVEQPEAIWSHPDTSAVATADGWHVVVPLWTTDEFPSDLSAELSVSPDGSHARVLDVHVL